MKTYLLILTSLFLLAGSLYSSPARADTDDDTYSQSSSDAEFRNTDDPQESTEDRQIPGQATPGTDSDPNVYHCGVNSACN